MAECPTLPGNLARIILICQKLRSHAKVKINKMRVLFFPDEKRGTSEGAEGPQESNGAQVCVRGQSLVSHQRKGQS